MPATHDAQISLTRDGRSTTVRLFDYLTPELDEEAARAANVWIKSLRHVELGGVPQREAFSYRGDSLWWFTELYLHKQQTINRAFATIRALGWLIESERPERLAIAGGDSIVRAIVPQVAGRRGVVVEPGASGPRRSWSARVASAVLPGIYAISPVLKRMHPWGRRPVVPATRDVDVALFVHSAFWQSETGEDTYLGPLVDALRSHFGERLQIVRLGPPTPFRTRTWRGRIREFFRGEEGRDAHPSIEAFSSVGALAESRRFWKSRVVMANALASSAALRRAAVVDGIDLWDVLEHDFSGVALLQAPWAARAMDEAAAALDALRPRVVVTYAEAGGWGRALVLEARRRGIASVGLQHGFISRHWLNYLHEPDEAVPHDGFPFPTLTLLYDDFARQHLERNGRFPSAALRVVGNPRLESLRAAAGRLTDDDRQRARDAAGARPNQHLVLLAIKYRPAWHATLQALVQAVSRMPDVHLAIRPHPGDAPTAYDALVAGRANVRVVPRRLDAVALITTARLVVTINSTVAIEALALGTPSLAMRLPNYLSPFVDAGAMAGTRAAHEIGPAIRALVEEGDARAAQLANAARFLEQYRMMPDGRSAERTVAAVEELTR